MTSTERGRRKYDALADRYEEIYFYVADLGRRLIEFVDPAPGTRVLDVGAGRGAVARAALARGCLVTAVDASAGMVAHLAADYPELTVHQMDAGRLDFPSGSFDLVTAGFVIQIMTDPAVVLTELRRVLTPTGAIALSLETQDVGRMAWLEDLSVEFFAGGRRPPEPTRGPLIHDQLDDLLDASGFVGITRTSVRMPQPIPDPPALWAWLAPRGLADAVGGLPAERAEEFHRRFLAAAGEMQADGGITLDFAATLHRATVG
ncbi:MAG: class I SAM-dependent methyltransferase [Labedaea sp.]